MKTKCWPWFFLLGGLWGGDSLAGAANEGTSGALSVRQLIAQLGDEQYLLRQRAETQLMERGVEVFGELQAAENHADLEIATRARYLLNQIRIEWVRPTDPPIVRSILAGYGELPQQLKLSKVSKLSRLKHEQGFGALCRIARFESSSLIARYAALAILEKGFLPAVRTAAAVATLTEEMGESVEVPVSWIRIYVDQLQSPERIDPRWLAQIDAEIDLLLHDQDKTSALKIVELLRCHLEMSDELADAPAIAASLQRRIDLFAQREEETELHWGTALTWTIGYSQWQLLDQRDSRESLGLVDTLIWLIEREQWQAIGLLEDRYVAAFESQPWLIYLVAESRSRQGRLQEAEKFAERALGIDWGDAAERIQRADLIAELGRHDWAEREWNHLIETLPVIDFQSLSARQSLAIFRLHDRGENQAAADLLAKTIDAIREDPAAKQLYLRSPTLFKDFRAFQSYHQYFLACHHQSQGDYEKQRKHLEEAYKLDPAEIKNVDILIAMHRLPDSKQAYRMLVQRRIAKAQGQIEKQIKQALVNRRRYYEKTSQANSVSVRLAAQSLNHWAWLIGNTEGDFDKAVKYSRDSLQLQPGNPSYLDTLGRCYYAAGDLENALKIQREAVAKHAHLMVMQRQLQLFEDELQKREEARLVE